MKVCGDFYSLGGGEGGFSPNDTLVGYNEVVVLCARTPIKVWTGSEMLLFVFLRTPELGVLILAQAASRVGLTKLLLRDYH